MPSLKPFYLYWHWRFTGRRISRDQWAGAGSSLEIYRGQRDLPWPEVEARWAAYAARAAAAIAQTSGRVLEVGCGIGNLTARIAARPQVSSVIAVDGFSAAIDELAALQLPKVEARVSSADSLRLQPADQFDTVVLCEFLEHLYIDEEASLLAAIRPHLAPGARWVVSVPIGWLEDPHHVRAFSIPRFHRHLRRHFGPLEGHSEASGYAQVAWGAFSPLS